MRSHVLHAHGDQISKHATLCGSHFSSHRILAQPLRAEVLRISRCRLVPSHPRENEGLPPFEIEWSASMAPIGADYPRQWLKGEGLEHDDFST